MPASGVACVVDATQTDAAFALARSSKWVVQLWLPEAAQVAQARAQASAEGLLGRSLYVERGPADRLPLADNMVDLALAAEATPQAELLRVLSPIRGRARVRSATLTKPALPGSDDWTHRLHGPDNNPAATDTAFQMPATLQFLGLPKQTSFQGSMLVEGGRRIELSDWVIKHPSRNLVAGKLLARSLYNGQVLWERELPKKIEPDEPIVALDRGRVLLAADEGCRVLVIDAETGRDLPSLALGDDQARVKWLAIENKRLYALLGEPLPTRPALSWVLAGKNPGIRGGQTAAGQAIVAWDLTAGRELWRHAEPAPIDYRTIAVRDGRTYYYSEKTRLACLDASGALAWENHDAAWLGKLARVPNANANTEAVSTLRVGTAQLRLALMGRKDDFMFALSDGKLLWQGQASATDFFVGDRFYNADGAVDPATGKAVEKGLSSIGGWCGIFTWVPALKGALGHVAFGMRSPCGVGIYAAGGTVNVMPSQCDCWPAVRGAGGFIGAADLLKQIAQSPQHPLEGGPAPAPVLSAAAGDWPTYRGDTRRTGAAAIPAGPTPQVRWATPAPQPFAVPPGYDMERMEWLDRPTPPVTAGGLAFLGGSDGAVRAVKLADGKPIWTYWTGGAVLTSPAVAGGRVYAGSADGWLYCLDAATGQLAWRWRGAPAERRMMVYGKLMSSWPVTAVLLSDGVVYGVAGQWMACGVVTFALDAATGRERWAHWTPPDYNHFLQPYLDRPDPAFAPCGQLALVGGFLFIRDYEGVPVLFGAATGQRAPIADDLREFQKKHYWNFGSWFATAGQDVLVVDDHLLLQGGYPLLGNPDMRFEAHAKFVGCRVNDDGSVSGLPHPPNAIPRSQIAPALAGEDLVLLGGGGGTHPETQTTVGLSAWSVAKWREQLPRLSDADTKPANNTNPLLQPPSQQTTALDFKQARWRLGALHVNAVALATDAVVAAVGEPKPHGALKWGEHPGFVGWKLAAFDRATGQERWSVALPGEPVFNGLAPASSGAWVVALRDGSVVVLAPDPGNTK
jgi:outer membrane protein assembly factor BamB